GDIPVRTLDPGELHRVLPILADYQGQAMLDVDGGAIRTLSAVEALSSRLRDELVADHVISVRQTTSGTAEVRTGTRCGEFEHVVVCAGRGTAALAQGAGLTIPVEAAAHVRLTFPVRGDAPERLPTFQDGSGAFGETGVYASPYPGNQFYSVGLSETVEVSDDGSVTDPSKLAALADRTTAYVERGLPGLAPRPTEYVHCWVTTLPWGEDGVGIWSAKGVSAIVGHNLFKQAPALGEALADTALGSDVPELLHPDARLGHD
ncbi:MAG TPA: FAD-dependent oxidoreductase, partial [Arthrobacter sp.]|nr:FAD-dependent oxidoreductase [Arthrobacter sp.]